MPESDKFSQIVMPTDEFRAWRDQMNLTQEEVATKIGYTRMTISRFETGKRQIPVSVWWACTALANGLPLWRSDANG